MTISSPFKIGKFDGGRTQDAAAPIIFDGTEIGWVQRNMSERFASESSRRRIYSVSDYDVVLTEAAPGGSWESLTLDYLAAVQEAIETRLVDVSSKAAV